MSDVPTKVLLTNRQAITRRQLLRTLGAASVGVPLFEALSAGNASAQGRCMLTFGSPACNTSAIKPVFEPTGWKTIGLEQITFRVAEYQKEAAFYAAVMGWTLRDDDGKRAVMDLGDWGSVIFKQAAPGAFQASGGGGGRGGPVTAAVESFGFVIDRWDPKKVEAELKTRELVPVADNDNKGFENFHIKNPNNF